jgi:glycosyltransferase involved in cell wall biosynthesis
MMVQRPRIAVVTPVKNESAILDRFLAVTSQFADNIIIADQGSTDDSPNISARYPKVTLIRNDSLEYDEASRQKLLIEKARELVPAPRIILALDADEVLAANATMTLSWQEMLRAQPGTVLCFEKPDLYPTPSKCIRYETPWPVGYVDDGAEHRPKKIHSIRIPMPDGAPRLHIKDVKILHYGMINLEIQAAKRRMYCVLENVNCTLPAWRRRMAYASSFNWATQGRLEDCPREWFNGWERLGINMMTVPSQPFYWYDYEVLKQFKKYGVRRFWSDDIWNFDWEACRVHAKSIGIAGMPDVSISPPPIVIRSALRLLDKVLPIAKSLRRKLTSLRASSSAY